VSAGINAAPLRNVHVLKTWLGGEQIYDAAVTRE
jgi:hypothetical protein